MKPWMKFAILVVGISAARLAGGRRNQRDQDVLQDDRRSLRRWATVETDSRLRVGGDVQTGSIVRDGKEVHFRMTQDTLKLHVVYTGSDPLPDTFRDGSQALADGNRPDGVFQATRSRQSALPSTKASRNTRFRVADHQSAAVKSISTRGGVRFRK